jgi:predicted Zn-dependent protease
MKRLDFLPVLLLFPIAGFVVTQAVRGPRTMATAQAAVLDSVRAEPEEHAGPSVASYTAASMTSARNVSDIRDRIRRGEQGTYISEILASRDSSLARWPDRISRPIRVWVGSGHNLRGWDESYVGRVREAFDEWTKVGLPLAFTFVVDSAGAEVRVIWVDQFNDAISGKTLWARDRNWWIVNGTITLALHHNGGDKLDARAIRAIALHEIGHLLGLDHTGDTSNIMTARVRVRELSDADRNTARLIYSVPPGSIR